jgi:hypothetical protein
MRIQVERAQVTDETKVRIVGHIESAEGRRSIWFDFPRDLEPDLCTSGEPWLLLMLPYAAKTGEPIELALPVDPMFLENIRGLIGTWASWYPELKRADIAAPTERASRGPDRAAQFFSGGVDSWFTLLRHAESTARFPQVADVDDLITVWGFDIAIDAVDEFRQLAQSVAEVAEHYGKRSIWVATNLRDHMEGAWKTVWGPQWGPLTHGSGLAVVALLLGNRYSSVRIASTHRFWEPFPYGSHPMTDQLFSTSTTAFLHDHALYSRTDKIERIAESDFAMSKLKVCFAEGTFKNCSLCVKCHRMLLCFDALGILPKATSFDLAVYQRNRDRPFLISSENDYVRAIEVRDLALGNGRPDIAALIDESIRRSNRVQAIPKVLQHISWRAWRGAYDLLAAGMIGR